MKIKLSDIMWVCWSISFVRNKLKLFFYTLTLSTPILFQYYHRSYLLSGIYIFPQNIDLCNTIFTIEKNSYWNFSITIKLVRREQIPMNQISSSIVKSTKVQVLGRVWLLNGPEFKWEKSRRILNSFHSSGTRNPKFLE